MRLLSLAAPIAERQLGLVAHRQLRRAGATPSSIYEATCADRLVPMERGVSLVAGAPVTADVRLLAKVLSAGDDAVLSHRSAAWLRGLLNEPPHPHEVSVPRGRRPRTPGLRVHSSSDLDLVISGTVRGLPVTDVGRTILDCARFSDIDLDLMVDEARRTYRISRTLLPWVVAQHARPGRPGVERLRALLTTDELPHSNFERLVTRWLHHHGITGWTLHHHLVLEGFGPVEPDITWIELRLILELEGADHRDRQLVHDHDTERQNALHLAGWSVLRVTYRRWLRNTDAVLAEIRTALASSQLR